MLSTKDSASRDPDCQRVHKTKSYGQMDTYVNDCVKGDLTMGNAGFIPSAVFLGGEAFGFQLELQALGSRPPRTCPSIHMRLRAARV